VSAQLLWPTQSSSELRVCTVTGERDLTSPQALQISISTMIDFAVAQASAQIATVQAAIDMYGQKYQPSHDFYREWREAFDAGIATRSELLGMRRAANAQTNPHRKKHYLDLASNWEEWQRKKKLNESGRPRETWVSGDLTVSLRPELVLSGREGDVLVKLYVKEPPLSLDGARVGTRLMALRYVEPDLKYGVLDVRRGKLWTPKTLRNTDAWLEGQRSSLCTMWQQMRNVA
jgi:hypothetical protein